MPQFDQTSFLNQIFWLLFFFFNFYFFITFFFLPFICKILKFRKKKYILNTQNSKNFIFESIQQQSLQNIILSKTLVFFDNKLLIVSSNMIEHLNSYKLNILKQFNFTSNIEQFFIQILLFSKINNKNK